MAITNRLEAGGDVTDFARLQPIGGFHRRREDADLHRVGFGAGRHRLDLRLEIDHTIDYAHVGDDALVGVVVAIKDQGAQRRFGIAARRRRLRHDRFQQVIDADAFFRRYAQHLFRLATQDVHDLLGHLVRSGGSEIDLVEHRHDRQVGIDRQVQICQRLRLHALRRIDDEDRAFARVQGTADFVGEVHVSRRIDQVHLVFFAVARFVLHAHGRSLDRHALFALQIHRVEHLFRHLTRGERAGVLQQAIRQRRFAVIDVRDDAKIPDVFLVHA